MSYKFCEFAYFSSSRLPSSILDPPGLPWGRLLAPQMAETSLEIRLGPPESRSRLLFFGSKRGKRGFPKGAKKGTPNGAPKCQARGNARSPSHP